MTKGGKLSGFTLVELIVVITILIILGTIAFISLVGYAASARDSVRVSDLANITKGLELMLVKSGTVPPPEAPVGGGVLTLSTSGGVNPLLYQGIIGPTVLSIIKLSDSRDPVDKKYYTYATNAGYTMYQLLGFFENSDTAVSAYEPSTTPLITQAYAGYDTRTPATKRYALGALLGSTGGTYPNQPLQELIATNTTLDIVNFSGILNSVNIGAVTSYFSKSDTITGTGNTISTPMQISLNNKGSGFNSPDPSICPTGFVSVPGNKEFNQPGFCVSKYAMTYSDADVPDSCDGVGCPLGDNAGGQTDWNTIAYKSGKVPVSVPNKFPIVNISQTGAITTCQSMGADYHLITNNEWMTIARNIEQVGDNWNTGIVGSGGIYRGITSGGIYINGEDGVLGCRTIDSIGKGPRIYAAKPLSVDTTKFGTNKTGDCDSKRQLKLSNNQIIWDLSGNIWNHVNKGNTLEGFSGSYNDGNNWVSNACNASGWYALSTGSTADGISTCGFSNNYTYANIGPRTPNLNANNGVGRIYSFTIPNNVFFRGGHANAGMYSGIFTTYLYRDMTYMDRLVGFRCAR